MALRLKRRAAVFGLLAGLLPAAEAFAVALPECTAGDQRIAVPVWEPEFDDKGNLLAAPPMDDGLIVYVTLMADDASTGCVDAPADKLYSFSVPDDYDAPQMGGLAVNLRGNVQFANGACWFSGFYMNEPVFGMHQGWSETYFGAVDTFTIIQSGRFCLQATP